MVGRRRSQIGTIVDRFIQDRWVQLGVVVAGLASLALLVFGVARWVAGKDSDSSARSVEGDVAQPGAPAEGGYGPTRTTLSGTEDHVGFLDGPHFNSIVSTSVYGNELAFLDAKRSSDSAPGAYQDRVLGAEGRYRIRAYIVNDASDQMNSTGKGQARNTRIRFELPDGIANGFTIQARVTADNAIPREIYDQVTLANDGQSFDLDYAGGSARLYNRAHPGGLELGDGIVDEGVLIGFDQMDGLFPAGDPFSAFVVIEVDLVRT